MNDLDKHKEEFDKIIKKYNLFDKKTAQSIANYLTKHQTNKIDIVEFAEQFNMKEEDVIVFVSFIVKGVKFKEKHLDKKR